MILGPIFLLKKFKSGKLNQWIEKKIMWIKIQIITKILKVKEAIMKADYL